MADASELREKAMKETKKKVKKEKSRRDKLAVQVINSIDNLDKSSNTMLEQFKGIYSFYFPELEDLIEDTDLYLKLTTRLKERENFTEEKLKEKMDSEQKTLEVSKAASSSSGADLSEKDLDKALEVGELTLDMRMKRKDLEKYLEELMEEITPNLKAILGAPVAARLMSEAGSLEKLMKMPSSTVQVLGAEKALFAHLNKGVKPPKHGIIFQYPKIKGSKPDKRGKIARKVASKASIASRIDYFDGEYRGDKLKKELEEEIKEILKD